MEKKRDVRNVMMVALVVAILVMAVGYAALSQKLTVNGTATIGDAQWKVRITDIAFDEANSSVDSSVSTQSLEDAVEGEGSIKAKFNVTLAAPGDKAVYNVTVKNLGTIEAELQSITDLTEINAADPSDIKFTVTPAEGNADTLAADATHEYTITVEWVKTEGEQQVPTVTEKTAEIVFEYVQA